MNALQQYAYYAPDRGEIGAEARDSFDIHR